MPPSSVLSTRYRTARRYPVICRGPTTRPCRRDIALLLARCDASASAGGIVRWCQLNVNNVNNVNNVQAENYATRQARRWDKPGGVLLLSSDYRRVTLTKADRSAFGLSSRACVAKCYAGGNNIVPRPNTGNRTGVPATSARRTVNSCYDGEFSPTGPSSFSCPGRRSSSVSTAAERKQQDAVIIRSRRSVQQLLAR
ncbi:hypothetical protein QLX08_000265 [Tetragonisca angustula]|uniref:Uncharacterized protein n=1 Tax=Tetragonisca angustula TaxID=166442 RepID=A0AAW1AJ02_9HYME